MRKYIILIKERAMGPTIEREVRNPHSG